MKWKQPIYNTTSWIESMNNAIKSIGVVGRREGDEVGKVQQSIDCNMSRQTRESELCT